jgi:hypothetical protein
MTFEGALPAERPITAAPATPADRVGQPDDIAADPRALQILTTEHWSLLSARSLVYNEAFARAGMFLTFLSASLVALALVGQALSFSREFLVLAAAILGADVILGLATYGRMMNATVEDLRAIHGMNRLRAGYAQIAPSVLPYLVTSTHDDVAGVFGAYGSRGVEGGREAFLHGLSTTSGMIAAIIGLLAGALASVLLLLVATPLAVTLAVGLVVVALVFISLGRRSTRTILGYQEGIVSRFPSDPGA